MNNSEKYQKFALCKEMLETAQVVKNFRVENLEVYAKAYREATSLLLTGEGSSRIFPAKHSIYREAQKGFAKPIMTEGATQALEYNLKDTCVFGASNSGRTKELIRLFDKLKKEGNSSLYGLTAGKDSLLESKSEACHVLHCGDENAVAATKSVAEQALFLDAVRAKAAGEELSGLNELSQGITEALTLDIDPEITKAIAGASTIFFAGRNNGVAEELTLKTNEITRKKSDYLEGTYAAHGIEEIMSENDVVIVIDPFEEEEEKFTQCLSKGVGVKLISISSRKTSLDYSIVIPEVKAFQNYLELAAGWNLLVEVGLFLGIDLDTPVRARKVGNEFIA